MDVREVHEELRRSPLSHPTRLTLMVLLVARNSVEFSEAVKALGSTPGALWTHVKLLEKRGLLETRHVITARGPRLYLRVTEKGIEETLRILRLLKMLGEEVER